MLVEDEKPPPAFLCPIMGDIMRDPCSCTDGHSYERQSIAKWLEEHETSPVTGAPLPSKGAEAAAAVAVVAATPVIDVSSNDDAAAAAGDVVGAPAEASDSINDAALAGPLDVGIEVLYTQGDGQKRIATIIAVNPGPPDDPEPSYTIQLDDGAERDTIRSRLVPIVKPPEAAAATAPSSSPSLTPQQVAAQAAEELARREAVERSRLEARQARAERRVAAEQAAAAKQQQEQSRRHQQQQQNARSGSQSARARPQQYRQYPGRDYVPPRGAVPPFGEFGLPGMSTPGFGGPPPFHQGHGMPPHMEDPFRAAGEQLDQWGRAIRGTVDEWGRNVQGFFSGLGVPGAEEQRRPHTSR